MAEVTNHGTLLQLLGQWVTVTDPQDHHVWHGQLGNLMDAPSLVLHMPEGGTKVLPQAFDVTGAAPAAGGPHPDPDSPGRPFEELRETGLLWLINRVAFHPRGLALALYLDGDGKAHGWSLVSNLDGEPWQFDPATDNDGYVRAEATIEHYLGGGDARMAPTARCCVCGGGPVVYENYQEQPFCAGCANCSCDQVPCARTPADDVRTCPDGHPDADVQTGGHVRTLLLANHDGCPPTCTDTVRTHPDADTSGRPDGTPSLREKLTDSVATAFALPPDLLAPAPCSCGQTSPLVHVAPDGGHWHLDPAEYEKLERGRDDIHPATAAWSQCWDRAEGYRIRLGLARQVLIDDGFFADDQIGDDLAPRLLEWVNVHRARIRELAGALTEALAEFTVPATINHEPALRTGYVNAEQVGRWRATLGYVRRTRHAQYPDVQGHCPACGSETLVLGDGGHVQCTRLECPDKTAASSLLGDPPNPGFACRRTACTAALNDLAVASAAYEVVRSHTITAGKYIAQQRHARFPFTGDNRGRILQALGAWTGDPGPLKLATRSTDEAP
ncbi:hypothetical protein [Streptomyces sp. NBC_00425]|uniref:hypothetical protein n=1 Tax=Streptomyces sp. NBC_00425 TaxID=2975740 RepID=UPI002E23A602